MISASATLAGQRQATRPVASPATGTIDLTVVGGAGHVGIPLVLCFAGKGLKVMINDFNMKSIEALKAGKLPFVEYEAQELLDSAIAGERIVYTTDPSGIGKAGPVIVTIGTPVDEFLNPIHSAVKDCIDGLLPHLADGQLLILRSTVYPGTTDWLAGYLAEKGRKIKVAFCPERVIQGYGVIELRSMPQIVSGTTPEAEEEAAKLFSLIAPDIVRVTPMEAEFAKMFSNVYRYIEFATTNQFYMITQQAGVDYDKVLEAMKRNYPRAAKIPGPGFAAGPCLFKDTMQLAAFSGNNFALGHAAMLVNEGLVLHVVERMKRQYDLAGMTVGLLGMAFKPEVDDTRASLSYKLKKSLLLNCKAILATDPFVKDDDELLPLEQVLREADILVLCTPHQAYKHLDIGNKPLLDIWSFVQTTRGQPGGQSGGEPPLAAY